MDKIERELAGLSDSALIDSLKSLTARERGGVVYVLRHLNEFEARRLAAKSGYPSLFHYCVRELRYAAGEAMRRIQAARAAVKYRVLYRMLERGALSLTTVALLSPHLTRGNHRRLIRASMGRNTREVEALLASMGLPGRPMERVRFIAAAPVESPSGRQGMPPAESMASQGALSFAAAQGFSMMPIPSTPSPTASPSPPEGCAPEPSMGASSSAFGEPAKIRVQFSFTADARMYRDVERAKELLRRSSSGGRLEEVFRAALSALLDKIDPDRRAVRRKTRRPMEPPRVSADPAAAGTGASAGVLLEKTRVRAIPKAVRDAIWRRDGGRCVFRAPEGRVCGARVGLEVDHVIPWARGGASAAGNLRLLCRAHNDLHARRTFGDAAIDAAIVLRREAKYRKIQKN